MIVLSDIPTLMLEKTLIKNQIDVNNIYNFPNELDNLNFEFQEILVIIGEIFFKEIFQSRKWEKTENIAFEILEIFKITVDELTNKNNKVFITLIPTHFLVSDINSYKRFKKDSADLLINNLNNKLINYFFKNENVFFLNGIDHINSDYSKDYFRYSSYLNKDLSEEITRQFINQKKRLIAVKMKKKML